MAMRPWETTACEVLAVGSETHAATSIRLLDAQGTRPSLRRRRSGVDRREEQRVRDLLSSPLEAGGEVELTDLGEDARDHLLVREGGPSVGHVRGSSVDLDNEAGDDLPFELGIAAGAFLVATLV